MAKRNDTSKSGPTRNPASSKARPASRPAKPTSTSASIPNLDAWEDTIEEERARLMEAHSILNCVAIAMDVEDVSPADGPHYPTLIEKACDLINESISRLDTVNLGRSMKTREDEADDEDEDEFEEELTVGRKGKNEVREPSTVYGYEPEAQDAPVPDRMVH